LQECCRKSSDLCAGVPGHRGLAGHLLDVMPPKTTKRWVPVNRNAGAPGRAPAPALGGARDEHHAVGAGQPGWGSVSITWA